MKDRRESNEKLDASTILPTERNPSEGISSEIATVNVFEHGFGKVPRSVMTCSSLSIGARFLFAYLRTYAGPTTEAHPARTRILSESGWSEDTYYRYRKELIDSGLLRRVQKRIGKNASAVVFHLADSLSSPCILSGQEDRTGDETPDRSIDHGQNVSLVNENQTETFPENLGNYVPEELGSYNNKDKREHSSYPPQKFPEKKHRRLSETEQAAFDSLRKISVNRNNLDCAVAPFRSLMDAGIAPDKVLDAFRLYITESRNEGKEERFFPQLRNWLDPTRGGQVHEYIDQLAKAQKDSEARGYQEDEEERLQMKALANPEYKALNVEFTKLAVLQCKSAMGKAEFTEADKNRKHQLESEMESMRESLSGEKAS